MARQLSWSDVRGGLIALVVIAGAAFVTLKFSRVGALHGDTVHVYALVDQAPGLTPGSEVWLSGQKIGKVARIEFLPVTSDTSTHLLIDMQVLSVYLPAVHRDATALIRSGGSIIGAIVVYLTPGTVHTVAIRNGDTIVAKPTSTLDETRTQFGAATRELPVIMGNVHEIVNDLHESRGTIGAVMNGKAVRALSQTRFNMVHVAGGTHAQGTVSLIMKGGLTTRAGHVMARVDSVRALLASSHTSMGRLRRDSTLMNEVADIRLELAEVQRSLDESRGTAGRVMHDSAVTNALASAQQEMTLLFADLKKHPFRYISF